MSFQIKNCRVRWISLIFYIIFVLACSFTQIVTSTQVVEVTRVIPVTQVLPATKMIEATKIVPTTHVVKPPTRTPLSKNLIYFSAGDNLYRMALDGSYIEVASTGVIGNEGLAVDSTNNKLYVSRWDAQGQILVFDLQSRENIKLYNDGPGYGGGQGLAINPITSTMYLGLYYNGVYSLDINRFESWTQIIDSTVLFPLHGQRGQLQIDPANHHIYFRTAYNNDCDMCRYIWRVNFDGSNLIKIVPANGGDALDLDVKNRKLYFSDIPGNGTIMRANFDGSELETVFSIPSPYNFCRALVLDQFHGKIYLSLYDESGGYKGRLIARLNTDGTEFEMLYEITGNTAEEVSGGIALALQ